MKLCVTNVISDQSIRSAGRLSDARKVFAHRGWDVLPQGRRGQIIMRWGADMAWLANPNHPKRSVRNRCRKWAPWLKPAELEKIIKATETSNKRWSDDQSAVTLEITVTDRTTLQLRFIGACDDLSYEIRLGIKRARTAERARSSRAKRSSGRKAGKPTHVGPTPWELAGMSRRTYFRHKARGTKTPSRHIESTMKRDGISVPHRPIIVQSIEPISTLDLDAVDFRRFGITAIKYRAERASFIIGTHRELRAGR